MNPPPIQLPNARQPRPGVLTGGQPTQACLQAARAAGYCTVVNLRPPAEFDAFDEAATVRGLGLRYVTIPVASPADLTVTAVDMLHRALQDAAEAPVLVHCASGNRVGGLFALHARCKRGLSVDEALACGDAAGLTAPQLRDAVREKLQAMD